MKRSALSIALVVAAMSAALFVPAAPAAEPEGSAAPTPEAAATTDTGAAAWDAAAMTRRVDERLAERSNAEGVETAPLASDAEFLRRAYVDLTGRIPRVNEARDFLEDTRPDRRRLLIDALLEKPDHATHLAATWRQFLLPDNTNVQVFGGSFGFEGWLRENFADNKPYDQMVRELLLAQGNLNGGQTGPLLFYSAVQGKPEELAANTSRAFLGVQIQCAQCHDHPFDHWSQRDFWGYAAFFARLAPPQAQQQFLTVVADAEEGDVKLPDTEEVVPPQFLGGGIVPDEAGVTRRQKLADWFTAADNPYFAKAAVNRVWAHLFGRGLVDPVDDLGDHNPVSHPVLMDELADYFVKSGYDLRGLIRVLANTQAYQLTSASPDGTQVPADLFVRMAIKSLTAEQLYDCLEVATCRREAAASQQFNGRQFDASRQTFLSKFSDPAAGPTDYHAGIPQALTLMNGSVMRDAVDLEKSDVLAALRAPFFNDEHRVETLFLATLTRLPSDAEREKFLSYVNLRSTREEKDQALADVLWALLNSAEFTLNH